jgi:tetratricopeptide (TPR) repeat protein
MFTFKRCAKINVKVLLVLILIVAALGISLFAARQIRRSILMKMDLEAGQKAFENEDWAQASKHFREYLGRNPDNIEVLKKFAKSGISIRPLDSADISGALAAYRRVLQLDPLDEEAYEKLAMLYTSIDNAEELAYIARSRIKVDPNDLKAPLWLSDALIRMNKMDEARQTLEEFMSRFEDLAGKHTEYSRACLLMSRLEGSSNTAESRAKALEWLNKAVEYDSEFVESLVSRAGFYLGIAELARTHGVVPEIGGMRFDEILKSARKDLDGADKLTIEDPRIRLLLGNEWLLLGDFERANAELEAAKQLPDETIEEYFFDVNDWNVKKFILNAKLTLQKNNQFDCNSLADDTLSALTEKRHRIQALPSAIKLYIAADNVSKARECMDDFLENQYTLAGSEISRLDLAHLKALVARGEDKPYAVIDILRTANVGDAPRPELWLLLAGAYSRTDQTRLAIDALTKYLRFYSQNPAVLLQLAKEYLKLSDWNKASEAAGHAESLDPNDITIKLLRIEAGIHIAAEQDSQAKTEGLKALKTELAELRKGDPNRIEIRILQAIIAGRLGQPDQAEKELKLAVDECPEPLKAQMQLAQFYYARKQVPDAISTCRKACEQNPEVVEPWLALAGLYISDANYISARDCLTKGLDGINNDFEKRTLSIQRGMVWYLYLDQAEGIRLLREVAEKYPQDVRVRDLLLSIRQVQDDRELAQELIKELKTAEGQSGQYWRLYEAAFLLSSDNWRSKQQEITENLQYCMDLDPEWSKPVLVMAKLYEKLQDYGKLEETCRKALSRNPKAADVANVLMTLLENQKRFSDADKVLEQIETSQRLTDAWQTRLAISAGDFSRAIEELRASDSDQNANSKILLARLLYQQGQTEEAFKYLKEAEKIAPDSMAFTAAKVSILRAEGHTDEALQILNDYVQKNNTFGAYSMRAAYLAQQGELERAKQDYIKLTIFPNEGVIGYQLLSNFYLQSGNLDQAINALEESMDSYPENLNLKRRYMTTLLMRGKQDDRKKAYGILTEIETKLPQDPELLKLRAYQILEEQTPQARTAAREKLENVIKLEPTAVDAHLLLIQLAMQESQFENARSLAIRALGSNPDNPVLMSARARTELALDNTQMATELTHLVLRKDPNNAQARDVITEAAIKTNDPSLLKEARTLTKAALRSDPNNERLLILRTRVLVAMKVPEEAISEMEAYCQTEEGTSSIPALVTLADLYRLSNNMDQAKRWIDKAAQIDGNNLAVIHARFMWLVAQNRFDELTGISSKYLSAKEQNAETFIAAASFLSASDKIELKTEGLKLFERAVTLSPVSKNACIGLASTLYQTGDAERAIEKYQELLKQYPNDIQVLNDLAWILQEHDQRYDDALKLANKGLNLAPNELHLLDTRGTILANMKGRLNDAMNDYKKLIELIPADTPQKAKAQRELGLICFKLNDIVQAKKYLQDALEIDQKIKVFTPDERLEIMNILQENKIQAMN